MDGTVCLLCQAPLSNHQENLSCSLPCGHKVCRDCWFGGSGQGDGERLIECALCNIEYKFDKDIIRDISRHFEDMKRGEGGGGGGVAAGSAAVKGSAAARRETL